MSFLDAMRRGSAARCAAARAIEPDDALRVRALATAPPRPLVLSAFDVIAEVKLRSPALGQLSRPADGSAFAAAQAQRYASAGAAAVSVLTEPERFDGDLAHLRAAAEVTPAPCMRKDFLVDPYQIWEARAAGAGGVLLITRMLDDATLDACAVAAELAGLFVLVEAFDAEDLARSAEVSRGRRTPFLVGVNTRDLSTLEVDPDRLARMAQFLPLDLPCVAESGIESGSDVRRVRGLGYRLALVGGALMRAEDPRPLVDEMLAAGRSAG
jgi:indole-3-glycerol phosphate synthase